MRTVIPIFLIIIGFIVPTMCTVNSIQFTQQCSGYLKQTADANTAEIALERLNLALDYIESHGLTSGYTSILWRTEDENVEFWYRNLKACQSELEQCMEGTQLEKSNVLMKVRESLTDDGGERGLVLTIPEGLARYPNNLLWAIGNIVCWLLLCIGIVWLVCNFLEDDY